MMTIPMGQPENLSRAVTLCATRILLAFVLAAGLIGVSPTQARSRKSRKSGPSQDLPDRINNLVRQLYGVQLVDAGNIPDQVQDLVIGALTPWMNKGGFQDSGANYPPDVRVRMQLEKYFSKLHYPFFGQPAVFVKRWNEGELIGVGYTLGWSDYDRVNVFVLYESKAGKTEQVALTHFFPGTDMHYDFLPHSPSGVFRFMVYGSKLGKSQPRLSAALYAFDGQKLQNLWDKQDLYDGKLNVTPETVTFRYLIESEYIQAVQQGQFPQWHEDIYQITPQGLLLQTERLLPYKSAS